MISIPDYPYESGDSWGIAMFRETSILYSNNKDAPITKQNTALAVAQQIAQLVFCFEQQLNNIAYNVFLFLVVWKFGYMRLVVCIFCILNKLYLNLVKNSRDSYWFNKAAASYLKYKVVSSLFPEWDVVRIIKKLERKHIIVWF